jgi:5-methylcytosine-specific restriction protein A
MKNRFNRHRALNASTRFKQEQQALRHAMRDPVISAMYDSAEWQTLRALVRHDAAGRCEWPGCSSAGHCVDHRVPHKGAASLFFNRSNLWLLCKTHHDRKTARFDGGFGREVRPFWPMRGPQR